MVKFSFWCCFGILCEKYNICYSCSISFHLVTTLVQADSFAVLHCSRSGSNLTWRQVRGRTRPAAAGCGSTVSWYWDGRRSDDIADQTQHDDSNKTDADIHDVLRQPARCADPGDKQVTLSFTSFTNVAVPSGWIEDSIVKSSFWCCFGILYENTTCIKLDSN